MKTFKQIVEEARKEVKELFPWDVTERMEKNPDALVLDIREECEYIAYHIEHSMLIPRGILETACEEEYEDSVPEIIEARDREVIVVCRSGNRSGMAQQLMQSAGFSNVRNLIGGMLHWQEVIGK